MISAWHGEPHHAKLTDDIVMDIRKRVGAGEFMTHIARELGVRWTTVQKAVKRTTWRHVE
jgi:hypothetical protein